MKLYVNPLSTPALTVMIGAKAIDVKHEFDIIDLMTGAHKKPDYLKINPGGRVPSLSDGEFKLFESSAILRYMARKAKSALYPVEYQDRAIVDQWMDYVAHHIRVPFGRIQFNRMFAEKFGQTPDHASVAYGEKLLAANLPILESQIAIGGYVAGTQLSLADIVLLGTLEPCEVVSVDLSPYPVITAWRQKLKAESFYTDVHSHFGVEIGL